MPAISLSKRCHSVLLAACLASAAWSALAQTVASAPPLRAPDVPYEPSAPNVVNTMLDLAKVGAGDVVFDLGCGDGRVVITAVKERGARGVCVDIDPQRIAEARENARQAGVTDRIEFRNQDLFETDISSATAVMLFLWPEINLKLRPKLWRDLRPDTRVVSHFHNMGDWKPEQAVRLSVEGRSDRNVYLWTIPKR